MPRIVSPRTLSLPPNGAICTWCEGKGKVERRHPKTRLLGRVPCPACEGQGRT